MLSWLRSSRKPSPVKTMIDQKKKPENYLGSTATNNRRCTQDIKSKTATAKAALNKKNPFTSKMGLNLRNKLVK